MLMATQNSPSNHSPQDKPPSTSTAETKVQSPVLCPHCKRTADNGIRCMGICIADSEY